MQRFGSVGKTYAMTTRQTFIAEPQFGHLLSSGLRVRDLLHPDQNYV